MLINGVLNWGDDHTTLSPEFFILAGTFQLWIQKRMR